MRRHLIGIGLAIVMILAMFFAGAWGYVRLLRLPAASDAPLSALPAQGGSLLSNGNVLAALGAVAVTGILAGILIAAPRISPLAAGLPGMFAIAWQALYLVSVHQIVQIIPLRAHAFGAGWEALLFNGVLGTAGLVMMVPLFVPSRWRSRDSGEDVDLEEDDVSEATGYMADLKATMKSDAPQRPALPPGAVPRSGPGPMPGAGPRPGMRPGAGPRPGMRAASGSVLDSGPMKATGPIPGGASAPGTRTGLVAGRPRPGGQPRPAGPRMPRPYRRRGDEQP